MFRLLPVGVGVGIRVVAGHRMGEALLVDGGSCLDGEEGVCPVVDECGSFPVITSSLYSKE